MKKTYKYETVDLLSGSEDGSLAKPMTLLKIGEQENVFSPFIPRGLEVHIHYGKEPEIKRYFLCNGKDCYYCKIGRPPTTKVLIPVYLPTSSSIGILPVTRSSRPFDLYPQIKAILRSKKRLAVFVSYRDYKYNVKSEELSEDMDCGEEVINTFLETQEEDNLKLPVMYESIENEDLAEVPEIAKELHIRGIL